MKCVKYSKYVAKRALHMHHKLLAGLACLAIVGAGYLSGTSDRYNDCNLNHVFEQQSFTSPEFDHNVVSDIFSDNIGSWNTSDSASDPTYVNSDSDDFSKSIWFKHGRIGLDNSSVWESDIDQDIMSDWSDRSDRASKYSFEHNNKMDPSDKMSQKHADKLGFHGDFDDAVFKYMSDASDVSTDEKSLTYKVNNPKHDLTITVHQPHKDITFAPAMVKSITYHLSSIHGILPTKYHFVPVKIETYNHKRYNSTQVKHVPMPNHIHSFTLSKSAKIK